jgi:ribonucleoside-diphosphate reductase alpha chain
MIKIEYIEETYDVYDITVEDNENFYANDILVHNCQEITLPTRPLNDLHDDEGQIALCTLSAINWGNIKETKDFENICDLAVRALDELLDYQSYPIIAAKSHTNCYRPLGVGIINLAYFLAKRGIKYSDPEALKLVDEYAEAWSYYLIKASINLAKEKGSCPAFEENLLKTSIGQFPIDTRKKDVDDLVEFNPKMNWEELRKEMFVNGIRNSTLMALMPSETSAQISNATNGVEPPRDYISIKKSKDGVLKQVVPEYKKLKKYYELLWDQKSPDGYLKIMAILQKYIDQSISTNTSYNPENYDDNQIPMSVLLKDLLTTYKFGIKTLYYMNTNDGRKEIDVDNMIKMDDNMRNIEEEICDGCTI